ncbi:hypothetical protein M2450_000471, partial [Dysgonomonas sp. PF1-23]|nr:hypothetical protein [Dysgonomonas sp. PF1-23]
VGPTFKWRNKVDHYEMALAKTDFD